MLFGGIALGIEDAAEVGGGEDTFGFSFQGVVAEEGVDALGDPIGVEDVGVL